MDIKIKGMVRLVIKDKDGNIKDDTGFMQNAITNASLAVFSGLAGNVGSQTAFTYLAVGTDSTPALASQTALLAEIVDSGLARHSATVTRSTTTQTNDTLQLDYTWTASASKTIEEIGVFNSASTGVMAGRKVTGSRALVSGDTLVATYKIIFGVIS
jgi:hypothetical protein